MHQNGSLPIHDMLTRVREQRDLFTQLMKDQLLIRDVHYATLKGNKPTLLKAGAIAICNALGLNSWFIQHPIGTVCDYDKPFFAYRYECQLYDGLTMVAQAMGSANSYEDKYKYEWVTEKIAMEMGYDPGNLVSDGNRFRILHRDPYRQNNTVDKMAQKSALVGAVLLVTGADFTQDWGDEQIHEIVTLDENYLIELDKLCAEYLVMCWEDVREAFDIDEDEFVFLHPEGARALIMNRAQGSPINVSSIVRCKGKATDFWMFDVGFGHALTDDAAFIELIDSSLLHERYNKSLHPQGMFIEFEARTKDNIDYYEVRSLV